MKVKKIVIYAVLFLCLEMAISIFLVGTVQTTELDMVKVNELTHRCEAQWDELLLGRKEQMPEVEYEYVVLDNDGQLLYAAQEENAGLTLHQAVKERATVIDLTQAGQAAGKLIIINDYQEQANGLGQRIMLLLTVNAMIIVIFLITYALYLQRTVFEPFRKLRDFASRVASGSLDIPLNMDRNNAFGAFTESFDLMRDELREAQEKERIANQSKKELVAKLSHDIKTPVASIKVISEVMSVETENEEDKKQLGIIEAKADQIDALISNLFQATLEELQELEVHAALQSSQKLRELIEQADYMKQTEIGAIPECLVLFDTLRLQQVFDNIIGNSYKYANTNVHVSAELSGTGLKIYFHDYGPGIAEKELPLVFEKFYRGKNAGNKSGTGLGLYISRYFMEQMEGRLTCENQEDGFCVCVSLKI